MKVLWGRVVVDEGLRRWLEWHFLADEPESVIVARIEAELAARGAGTEVLERYLGLREAMRGFRAEGDLEARWRAARELRARYGLEEMFASTDADVDAALARRAGIAVPLAAEESATVLPLATMRVEAALRATGAGEADIHALRAATFGEAAAERLAELDRRRAERLRGAARR